jgi:shikimate dehydrogenase
VTATPTASTRLLALLGDPVHHSLSPVFQNAAIRAAGLDGVFLALRCDAASLPTLLLAIARAGGAGNVTVPHKERAAAAVERRTPAVERTGACNAYWAEDGVVWGDNTDVQGATCAMAALLGAPPRGARVLLLGAGGAARAALCALVDAGAAEVLVLNRSIEPARRLAERFAGHDTRIAVAADRAGLRRDRFDLAINATSLGLRDDDPLPLRLEETGGFPAALDVVYRPRETQWVRALRAEGVAAADGLEMLLSQGAAAFERWWPQPAPLDVMRAALPSRSGDGRSHLDSPAG